MTKVISELRDLLLRHNLRLDVTSKPGIIALALPNGEVQFLATTQGEIVAWIKAGEPADEPVESLAQYEALHPSEHSETDTVDPMKMLSERTLIDDGKRFGDLTVGEIKTLNAVMERVMRIHQERMRLSEQAFDDVKRNWPSK